MKKLPLLLPLFVLASIAAPQARPEDLRTVTLQFTKAAPRVIWSSPTLASPPPRVPSTDKLSVSIQVADGGGYVLVLDETSGNLAARQVRGTTWQVADKEFTRVGSVLIRVDQGGKPGGYASVTIGDSTKLIVPESKGEARFYGLPIGTVRVEANFKVGDRDETTAQRFVLEAKRAEAVPKLVLSLGETTGATGSAGTTTKADPTSPKMPSGSILGTALLILLVAGGAIAGLVFGLKWIYANQDTAKSALGKIGVQVPEPLPADPAPIDPVAPPPVLAADPIGPIVLPDSAPGTAISTAQTPGAVLRLTGAWGVLPLPEGTHAVGREPGLPISLVGESTVSRRHAELVSLNGTLVVRDLGSTNGTFVNGVKVNGEQSVRPGDSVQFGSVQFRVE